MAGHGFHSRYYWTCYLSYMQINGTKEAFLTLIGQKGFAKNYGYTKSVVAGWKTRYVTIDKMEEVLTACGATVVKEKVWKLL